MTDAEIIKALECCSTTEGGNCKECPFCAYEESECLQKVINEAHELLQRQQTEIEKLTTQNVKLKKCFTIEFDDDKLKKIVKKTVDRITIDIKQAENEAIKEFAEKLKATFPDRQDSRCTLDDCYTLDIIDNLVKQVTGGENDG